MSMDGLQKFVDDFKAAFEEAGGMAPCIFYVVGENAEYFIPVEWEKDEEDKIMQIATLAGLFTVIGAKEYYHVSDTWVWSLFPDEKGEALVAQHVTHENKYAIVLPYHREGDRIIWGKSDNDGAFSGGRLTELLPMEGDAPLPERVERLLREQADEFLVRRS